MAITEAFGEFRTGKTQLSHTLCVTAQMPGHGNYHGGKVIFLDTEHTLYPLVAMLIYFEILECSLGGVTKENPLPQPSNFSPAIPLALFSSLLGRSCL